MGATIGAEGQAGDRAALARAYLVQALRPGEHGEHWSGPAEMVERIAHLAGTRPADLVLDVGCGVAGPARRLARVAGCRVVGVDLAGAVLSIAAPRLLEDGTGGRSVRLAGARAEALPFASGSFDQVWCLGVLAHLPDPGRAAREMARVLRPNGRLALTEAFWDGLRPPRFAAAAPMPWRPVTLASLVAALRSAGLAPRVLPWPGEDLAPRERVRDPALRADLLSGALRPRLVLAARP